MFAARLSPTKLATGLRVLASMLAAEWMALTRLSGVDEALIGTASALAPGSTAAPAAGVAKAPTTIAVDVGLALAGALKPLAVVSMSSVTVGPVVDAVEINAATVAGSRTAVAAEALTVSSVLSARVLLLVVGPPATSATNLDLVRDALVCCMRELFALRVVGMIGRFHWDIDSQLAEGFLVANCHCPHHQTQRRFGECKAGTIRGSITVPPLAK